MKVYVINKYGKPLMPTTPRKARLLLKEGKATIHSRNPFTIQLQYDSTGYVQLADSGIDSGYKHVGYSAVNETQELIGGELELLDGMSERLTEQRKYRRTRRNRKRHRAPRFDNRRRPDGWLPPSIQHKLDSHKKLIDRITAILPIRSVTIEVASFDTQKIKNPGIEGEGYQQGEQAGFSHLREYILHRDGHKCQNPDCKNKAKEAILQVHHIGYWKKDRSDRPGNLITLCTKCHTSANHKPGKLLYGWQPRVKRMKAETFMSMIYKRLAREVGAEITFGAETKDKRRVLDLEKSHHNDAFVIAGGTIQKRIETIQLEQIRHNKRSLEQFYDAKYIDSRDGSRQSGTVLNSGRRTRNKNLNSENLRKYRLIKVSKGQRRIKTKRYPYRQGDLVQFEGKTYAVIGMQNKGKGVKIANYPGVKNKVVKPSAVIAIRKRVGICYAA